VAAGYRADNSSREGEAVARIEQRRTLSAASPAAAHTLPVVAWVFLVLAAIVALAELQPVAEAWWGGATEWWSEVPQLLPRAVRSGAMIALPAAIAWAAPTRYRANAWLWKGALIVAAVAIARVPVGFVQEALFQLQIDEGGLRSLLAQVASLGVSVAVALASILGIWALAEGLGDAGGRTRRGGSVAAAVLAVAFGLLLLVPAVLSGGLDLGLSLVAGLVSVAVNMLAVFVGTLLAARAASGAIDAVSPARAWRLGAVSAVVLAVLPILSYGLSLVALSLLGDDIAVLGPLFGVGTFFGWPLFAVALAMGMGRVPRAVTPRPTAHLVRGGTRFVPVA
jgi:hypothetical protein